ncbi:hypothetical protein BS47DRAFT_1363596 [Hydnum rufescens UP504]|uniref:Uncharacterized protein n=1 Tax=Hydnum rufescens UP504 TaxID=1448309 RepID=A0A9P6ATP1_9AGAM|nr:hypothetical protein BS47DRAFT_1363596 [Hydnum rufescens UP504]
MHYNWPKLEYLGGMKLKDPEEIEQDPTPATAGVWSYTFKVFTSDPNNDDTKPARATRKLTRAHLHAKPACPHATTDKTRYYTPTAVGVVTSAVKTEPKNIAPSPLNLQREVKHGTTPAAADVVFPCSPSLCKGPPDVNTDDHEKTETHNR